MTRTQYVLVKLEKDQDTTVSIEPMAKMLLPPMSISDQCLRLRRSLMVTLPARIRPLSLVA